jgi:hypothetical protein
MKFAAEEKPGGTDEAILPGKVSLPVEPFL